MRRLVLHKASDRERDQDKAVQPNCPGPVSPGNAIDMECAVDRRSRRLEEVIDYLLRPEEVG